MSARNLIERLLEIFAPKPQPQPIPVRAGDRRKG